MRNVVLASLLTVWGAAIVLNRLLGNVDGDSGAYATGQNLAFLFGIVMVVAGMRALLKRDKQPT
jgi:hypothetical protein